MIIDHPGNIGERDPPVVSHGQVDHHQEHEGAQEEDDVGPEEHHQHRQEVADLGIKQGDADIVSVFQKFWYSVDDTRDIDNNVFIKRIFHEKLRIIFC